MRFCPGWGPARGTFGLVCAVSSHLPGFLKDIHFTYHWHERISSHSGNHKSTARNSLAYTLSTNHMRVHQWHIYVYTHHFRKWKVTTRAKSRIVLFPALPCSYNWLIKISRHYRVLRLNPSHHVWNSTVHISFLLHLVSILNVLSDTEVIFLNSSFAYAFIRENRAFNKPPRVIWIIFDLGHFVFPH